jgi:hypothetical protein
MKILLFIFNPYSWGNKSVQVRQAFIFINKEFCGDYPFFKSFFKHLIKCKTQKTSQLQKVQKP